MINLRTVPRDTMKVKNLILRDSNLGIKFKDFQSLERPRKLESKEL